MKKILAGLTLTGLTLFTTTASANSPARQAPEGWMWGAGVFVDQSPYTDFDTRVLPIPLIGYKSEELTWMGPFLSYRLWHNKGWSVSARIAPVFGGYEEDDSPVFAGMDDRDFSLGAGAELAYSNDQWNWQLSTSHDIIDSSDGYDIQSTLGRQLRFGPSSLEPYVNVTYQDSNLVDYYFGVTAAEATASRAQYTADAATNYSLGINYTTPKWGGMLRFNLQQTWFDNEIADSPLTDTDSSVSAMFSYSKFF